MKESLLITFLFFVVNAYSQCDQAMVYANDSTNAVCILANGTVRTIHTNDLPDHAVGSWPSGNPVDPQDLTFSVCAFPQKANQPTSIYDAGSFMGGCSQYVEFGVGVNGIRMAPYGARWFVNPNTQQENPDWNVEPLEMFNMDFNNSHSNGGGQYHYHGIPIAYFTDSLNIDGTGHSPMVGYAADGFPIYYKYAYSDANDPGSGIAAFTSGHTLIPGNRPGDGITSPDGAYDGFYVEDYEFLDPNWPLDECNGRFGVTPEYPNGTYYYLMTDNWPYIPRCFYGTVVDNSFRIGPNCPASNAANDCLEEVVSAVGVLDPENIVIGPNPSGSMIRILGLDAYSQADIERITMYDINGRVYFSAVGFRERIDVSDLAAGTYFVQVGLRDSQVTQKVVVEK